MRLSDDWPILILVGLIVGVFSVLVWSGVTTSNERAKFSAACYSVGGTPVMSDKGNYCVEKFADMREATP